MTRRRMGMERYPDMKGDIGRRRGTAEVWRRSRAGDIVCVMLSTSMVEAWSLGNRDLPASEKRVEPRVFHPGKMEVISPVISRQP